VNQLAIVSATTIVQTFTEPKAQICVVMIANGRYGSP
jgi:hypothetical protein